MSETFYMSIRAHDSDSDNELNPYTGQYGPSESYMRKYKEGYAIKIIKRAYKDYIFRKRRLNAVIIIQNYYRQHLYKPTHPYFIKTNKRFNEELQKYIN